MKITSNITCALVSLSLGSTAIVAKGENMKSETQLLIDFSKNLEGMEIGVTNDGVMGGLSQGKFKNTESGTIHFSGKLSLKNNGGFSSLRMRGVQWNLEEWKGIELRVKGDGRNYGFRVTTDQSFRGSRVSFTSDFQTSKDKWITIRVPFSAMQAGWRGRQLDRKFDAAKISGIGVILADKLEGLFTLEIKSVSVWR
jgi:NADH dehydrogenase [ubiquinone] 1 alpha subcomplex assembly factor 1